MYPGSSELGNRNDQAASYLCQRLGAQFNDNGNDKEMEAILKSMEDESMGRTSNVTDGIHNENGM